MIKLNNEYKINAAKELTELAIQNNLIDTHSDEESTAKAVCSFFKTIFENLDSGSEAETEN